MTNHAWSWFSLALVALVALGAFACASRAQSLNADAPAATAPGGTDMPAMSHVGAASQTVPILPGQDAFGAIQEIVRILDADPHTDWSKVDLEALRQHLIDMNEVTLRAAAAPKQIPGGLRIAVTGNGRTIGAIQRMVADQAKEIEHTHLNGWSAGAQKLSDGVILAVTAKTPSEIAHIRGLGFIGIMASGSHHQLHHLAMARGEKMP